MEKIRNLISEVNLIMTRYKEVADSPGKNFNIFKVLNLTTNETRTHSAFLAELLNPKGSHGQKDVFLNLFLEQLKLGAKSFDPQKAIVEVEKYAGRIDTDYESGGRLDIVLSDKNGGGIIIENKIYARDQEKQLKRYNHFGVNEFGKNFKLYYLTLDGDIPSNESTDRSNLGYDFEIISYKNEILLWLEKCYEKVNNNSTLSEPIKQYIDLIKYLTGTTMSAQELDEIAKKLIDSDESIQATFAISESLENAKRTLLKNFIGELKKVLSDYEISADENFGVRKTGITIKRNDWTNLLIRFEFYKDYEMLCYGIQYINFDSKPDGIESEISKRLRPAQKAEEKWPWWEYLEKGKIDSQTFIAIKNNTTKLYQEIKENIEKLSNDIIAIEINLSSKNKI